MIRVKKLNAIREIDERYLNEWIDRGYKQVSKTKSEYANILPAKLLEEDNVEEQEEPKKEDKKSSK